MEGSRFLDVYEPHEIRIVVLAWIKGKPQKLQASYVVSADIGLCNRISQLGYARHGDLVVIFADRSMGYQDGKLIETGLKMFAIRASEAADPRITSALNVLKK
jgi:hypothetical protein